MMMLNFRKCLSSLLLVVVAALAEGAAAFSPVPRRSHARIPPITAPFRIVGGGTLCLSLELGGRRNCFDRPFLHLDRLRSSASDDKGSDDGGDGASGGNKKATGDSFRAATGIRPSLHPTTINAIADALLLRSKPSKDGSPPIDVGSEDVPPLEVALSAGRIATEAVERRRSSAEDSSEEFTLEESQAIAGRVVGVVMRLREMEAELAARVRSAGWVDRYQEHGSFGVLKAECSGVVDAAGSTSLELDLRDRIRDDPLFRMCRAECLLALFLHTVEGPKLKQIGEEIPGGSTVDFIDADRLAVVLATNDDV